MNSETEISEILSDITLDEDSQDFKVLEMELKNHVVRHDINLGSLMRLFKSVYFDTWMNVVYLYKCRDNKGVVAFLCNELYKRDKAELEDFFPQLCNFLKFENYRPVLRFLIDQCCRNMHFALRITWLVDALLYTNGAGREHYLKMRDEIHIATLNGRRTVQFSYPTDSEYNENEDPFEIAVRRMQKCEYYNKMISFTQSLVKIGGDLVKVNITQRKERLLEELESINLLFKEYSGLYLPIFKGSKAYHTIVNIATEHTAIMTSRDRVPFLIWVEVIENENVLSFDEDIYLVGQDINTTLLENNEETASQPAETTSTDKKFVLNPHEEKKKEIRKSSKYGHLEGWNAISVIVKFGDDCRQERFALQLIKEFNVIFQASNLPLYLRPYEILVISQNACIIETIPNILSLHHLREKHDISIMNYLQEIHGYDTEEFELARRNFVESLAGYSIVSYLLQFKDRHNGNILLDTSGRIIHIDFGFMLSNSPGILNII
eukprot:TRINITY_DN226_c0_g1_i1.p1 TRINITY_DN226_c0_g1~~TRINITY_DN226_c0_g1_i1.p1  ORF type:complete len:517 (-),score=87.43 TRINITY_DN226_c0_g1_i1:436-1911(-)